MMIDVLHEMLDLTGSRFGCGQGICHACVVIWDRDNGGSEEVPSCITGAHFFDGSAFVPSRESQNATTRARSWRCRRFNRPFSTNSVSSVATARRASSTPLRAA